MLGHDPVRADEAWRARVGVVLQSWRDHPKWQVRELVDVAGAYYAAWSTYDMLRPWPTSDLLAVELHGTFQTTTALVVIAGWAVVGFLLVPSVLRRMANRQSGSVVAAARERVLSRGY